MPNKPNKPNIFDRSVLQLKSIDKRKSDLTISDILPLKHVEVTHKSITIMAKKMIAAQKKNKAVVLMIGGHVIRSGVQRYLIDLMKKGLISCVSMNGAGIIHDYEFALKGETTESVARYISNGQFGLWRETGQINEIVKQAAENGQGLADEVGRTIAEGDFPHADISILAAAFKLGIVTTAHVGIGYDIVYEHPNCDGAAYGATSYTDFLKYVKMLERLEGGVVMNFGSAVMAPEVFLKALAMVRNAAKQKGTTINDFTTLVCDLLPLPVDHTTVPARNQAGYFFRPWKTMLVRTVADGGESHYVQGPHVDTIPQLWSALKAQGSV